MSAIKLNEFCFAWYPKNIHNETELDLYYCVPVHIGQEYSTCILYHGNSPKNLVRRGRYTDVCTADLITIDDHTEKMEAALSVLKEKSVLPISTEVVPAEDGQYQVRFYIGQQGFSLHPCEKVSEDDNPEKEAEIFRINLQYALTRLKNFKG